MINHVWESDIDFGYGTHTNTKVDSGVKLDAATSGTWITDIKDSGQMFHHYDEFLFTSTIPTDCSIDAYCRVGDSEDDMGEWIVAAPQMRYEFCMSLTDSIIYTDYTIGELDRGVSEYVYRMEGGIIDGARVGFAIVGEDYVGDPGDLYTFVEGARVDGNRIILDSAVVLTDRNVVIAYIPQNFIPHADKRYIQFKFELEGPDTSTTPTISSMTCGYRLYTHVWFGETFPAFYRRL